MTSSRGKRGRATYVLRGPIRTPSTARTPECAREGARYRFSVDLLNKKLTSAINPHSSIEKPPYHDAPHREPVFKLSTSLTVAVLRAQRSISLFSGVPAGSLGLPGSSQQNLFQGGRGVSAEVPAAASVPTSPEPDEPGAAHQMTESALRRFELESSSTWCTSSRTQG